MIKRFTLIGGVLLILAAFALVSRINTASAQGGDATSAPTAAPTESGTASADLSVSAGTLKPEITLTFAGFSVAKEVYTDIFPLFEKYWQDKTGQKVTFKESYGASGAQSRAVVGGLKADIVALSLETDVTRIATAKLITHDWQADSSKGIVSSSVVVLAVRPGNPKGIKDWADLAKDGVEIVSPNPATSGGAQWNILAAFGAAKLGYIQGVDKGSDDAALKFLGGILKNVSVFDQDGRSSFLTFEKGIGDVALTYENEAYAGKAAGTTDFDIIYPPSSIYIENPASYIDVYVDQNDTRPAAEAFIAFLLTPDAQRAFAAKGYRPVIDSVASDPDLVKKFPAITNLFTIKDLGGWPTASKTYFGDSGKITALIAQLKGQ